MAGRSLNVVIAGDNRLSRPFNEAARDADKLSKGFGTLGGSSAKLGAEMGGLSLRVGAVGGSFAQMAPILAGAVPALGAVAGAVTALGASLTAAAGGATALGVGLAASLAPLAVVGKQVTSRFEDIKKAQEAVTKAQQDGTVESRKQADALLANLSKSERAMVSSLGKLSGLQDKVLGGASDRVFVALAGAIDTLAPKLEKLAKPFNELGDAVGRGIERIANSLGGDAWQDALGSFIDSATGLVRPLTTIFLRIGGIIRDVAVEALPYVKDVFDRLAGTFKDLDENATRSRIGQIVETLVDHTKSWWNLFKELGGLVANVFGASADKGKGLVDTIAGGVSAVSDFIGQMRAGEGSGGKFVSGIVTAFNAVREAVRRVAHVVSAWVDENRGDIDSVIDAFKAVGRFAKDVFEDTLQPIVRRVIRTVGEVIKGLGSTIRGLVRLVSGLFSGDWDKAWSGAKEAVSGAFRVMKSIIKNQIENIWEIVKDLGPDLIRLIGRGLSGLGKSLAKGIADGVKWAARNVPGMVGGVLKDLGGSIVGALIPGGDGIGKTIGDGIGRMMPRFGGSLMGADPQMAPIAGMASRFGLGVSSGKRAGAITSSGNTSWHSSGEALDVAGSPAGMKAFFNYMKNTMGGRLAELIYTPGGAGIKDGRSYTYGGAVAADHFDHVHVAMDLGHPGIGVGDGLGKFNSTAYGPPWNAMNGTGVTANGTDLRPARQAYGVAVDPAVIPLGSKLKITPNPFGYGGTFTAFDTGGAIKGNRIDFYDWRGRSKQMGWGRQSVNVELVDGSSSGGPSKGKPAQPKSGSVTATSGTGGRQAIINRAAELYKPAEARSDDEQRAYEYVTKTGRFAPARPLKGGGPTKGLTPEQIEAGVPEKPGELDYLDLALANAEATAGTDDDRSALAAIRDYRARALASASASGDPRLVAQARRDLTSAENALKALTDSINESNRLQEERDALDRQVLENQGKLLALASQGDAIIGAVIAAVSGGIGGMVGLGSQTPGFAGGGVNYGGNAGRL